MIIDIIELPFKGVELPEYSAITPVVLSTNPYSVEDVFMLGYNTTKPIHRLLFRYKIIEHINDAVYEHIALSQHKLPLDNIQSAANVKIYIVSTTVQFYNMSQTFRYHKTISSVLRLLDSNVGNELQSVHQLAINTLIQMEPSYHRMSDMEICLAPYVEKRHKLLCNIATASITHAVDVMIHLRETYDTLVVGMDDGGIGPAEMEGYLDMMLGLPVLPVINGICGLLVNQPNLDSTYISDLLPQLIGSTIGMHTSFLPQNPLFDIDECTTVNAHLFDDDRNSHCGLIEALTNIEVCGYSDLSIEIPYTDPSRVPDFTVHYSGSVFNSYSNSSNSVTAGVNIKELVTLAKDMYGVEYERHRPTMFVSKTFAEDVYIKFVSATGGTQTHYFDLTIMALLSPIILDNTAAQYVQRQMYT